MMAYPAALPYDRPRTLSAWEIPLAVVGAIVDCLTCRLGCRGEPSTAEETYWPAPVAPQPVPSYNMNAFLPREKCETKAVFTNIPLRDEAIRQGYLQPAEGDSPYTTLYAPPLGPPVRLVPAKASPTAAGFPVQTARPERFPGDVAAVATQPVIETAGGQAFVTAGPPVPSVQRATAGADREFLRTPYETVRLTALPRQGDTAPLGQHDALQREQIATGAYRRSYVAPETPRRYEVYLPSTRPWTPATVEQRSYTYVAAPKISQAVQTVFEEDEEIEEIVDKKRFIQVSGNEAANSEKDTSHTDHTLSERGSADSPGEQKRKTPEEQPEKKEEPNEKETGSFEGHPEGQGRREKSREQQGTTAAMTGGKPSGVTMPPMEERIITDTSISDTYVVQPPRLDHIPAANRCVVGFVPPIPPQRYKQIFIGGRPYLQGGVFYLSDTGAYLLGLS